MSSYIKKEIEQCKHYHYNKLSDYKDEQEKEKEE